MFIHDIIPPKKKIRQIKKLPKKTLFALISLFLILWIISAVFLFVPPPEQAQAAAITSAQSGNWSNTATWTGGVVPGDGDTVTVLHACNVDVNTTVGALTGVGLTISDATHSGSVTVNQGITLTMASLTTSATGIALYSNTASITSTLTLEAGSTLVLNNNKISLGNGIAITRGSAYFVTNGTAENRVNVTGITGSKIVNGNIEGNNKINWNYTIFDGIDDGTNANKISGKGGANYGFNVKNCLFKNCGTWQFGVSTITPIDAPMDFQYNDFRNITTRTSSYSNAKVVFARITSSVITGINIIKDNSFASTGGEIVFVIRGGDCTGNIFYNVIATEKVATSYNNDFTGIAGYVATATNHFLFGGGLSVLADSLFGADVSNNHGVNESNLTPSQGTLQIHGNVFDSSGINDNPFIIGSYHNSEIYQNIWISGGSAISLGLNVAPTGIHNIKRNTFAGDSGTSNGFGLYFETTEQTGTVNAASNLFYDVNSGSNNAVRADTGIGTDVLDYTDYNVFWPNGVLDRYNGITITDKTEGVDAGFGLYDTEANPNFVDSTRTIGTFDTSLGGAGTRANFFTELLKKNGFDINGDIAVYNSAYNIADAITHIRAGFTPTNAALRGAGDPADSSPDIGAVTVSNTAPATTYNSISDWNSSEITVSYNLIDADSDTLNISQTASSGIEYSTDGTNWSDATEGTGGDGFTALASATSPGTAHTFVWDTAIDLPSTEDSTVYLRIAPSDGGGGLSWTTSGAFGIDNVAPSSVGAPTFGAITASSIVINKPTVVTEDGSGLNQWQARRDIATELGFNATTTSSVTDSSLSENTQYTYDAQFSDYQYATSTYGTTATKYTLADTPTNFSGVSAQTSMTLSVDSFTNDTADSSSYYFENTTNSTNSNWIQTSSWQNTGLTCGTSYTYEVKYKNGDGTETSATSLTQSASACSSATPTTSGGGNGILGSVTPIKMPIPKSQIITPDGNITYLEEKNNQPLAIEPSQITIKEIEERFKGLQMTFIKLLQELARELMGQIGLLQVM